MAPSTTKTATPKSKTTGAGVIKKRAPNPKGRPVGKGKAGQAMAKMQAYFKENRGKYEGLDYKGQQKKLGEDWKKSPQNPKNST